MPVDKWLDDVIIGEQVRARRARAPGEQLRCSRHSRRLTASTSRRPPSLGRPPALPRASLTPPAGCETPPARASCLTYASFPKSSPPLQLTRNVQFFGRDAQQDICNTFIVIVGLGVRPRARPTIASDVFVPEAAAPPPWAPLTTQGVGSHAAHMLLRSGVGRLRLIDFDQARPRTRAAPLALLAPSPTHGCPRDCRRLPAQVTLSSLNRHAVATRADVGLPKATVLKRHFEEIMPDARVEACVRMYEEVRGRREEEEEQAAAAAAASCF